MKDVIERLEADAERGGYSRSWLQFQPDLKALLSYTKQCEEALRPFANLAGCLEGAMYDDHESPSFAPFNNAGEIRAAAKALSLIQHGE